MASPFFVVVVGLAHEAKGDSPKSQYVYVHIMSTNHPPSYIYAGVIVRVIFGVVVYDDCVALYSRHRGL